MFEVFAEQNEDEDLVFPRTVSEEQKKIILDSNFDINLVAPTEKNVILFNDMMLERKQMLKFLLKFSHTKIKPTTGHRIFRDKSFNFYTMS